MRAPVRSVFGVVCPRKLFERERAAEQGVTRYIFTHLSRLYTLSLFLLIFHSQLLSAWFCEPYQPNMPKAEDQDYKDMEKETVLFHGKGGKVSWIEFEKSIAR